MLLGRLILVVVVLELCRASKQERVVVPQHGENVQETVPRDFSANATENGDSDNEEKVIPEGSVLRESIRTSRICDDMGIMSARELCPDLTRNINVQDLQQFTNEEIRLLQRLYSRNQYPSYVNQGNSVHIQGGFQNPVPQVISTGGSHSLLMKNKPIRRPEFHYVNPQPSTVNFNLHSTPVQRPSVGGELPQSQSNIRQSTRINSKLLANITAASKKYFQNLRNYPMMQNSHTVGGPYNQPKNNNNPFLLHHNNHYSNQNSPFANNQGFITRPPYPRNVPTYTTPNVPVRNIVNVKMPNSPEKHTQQKADMAEILTNLQILTILMNQDAANKMDVKGAHKLPPGLTFANSDSVSETMKAMMADPKARRSEEIQQRHPAHGYASSHSVTFEPKDLHSHQPIEARTRSPDIFPGHFNQLPFPSVPNFFQPPLRNSVKNSERNRPNHVGQKAPGLSSYFLDQGSPGLPSFHTSGVPTSTVPPSTAFDNVGALVSPYTPQELLAESQSAQKNPDKNSPTPNQSEAKPENDRVQDETTVTEQEPEVSTDNEKLINQFAWNPNSVAPELPLYNPPQKPQVQGTQASVDKLEALYNYLAFMNNYQTANRPPSNIPINQNDPLPNLNNQDLLLTYLLQAQGMGQPLPKPPSGLQPDTPYIPAVHSGLYSGLQTEPQPPAPPPSSVGPPGASSGVGITQPLFTSGASASSIEDCLKSKVCAFFLAGLIAAGTTTALAIPIFTPIVGAGLLGRRRRRDVHYLVLTPENATEFIHAFSSFENGGNINKLTKDEKRLYISFLQQLNGNSQTVLADLKEYMTNNEDTLLNSSVKEIEYITDNPIPADLIHHLKHDTLNNQLNMLKLLMSHLSKNSGKGDDNTQNRKMTNELLQDSAQELEKWKNTDDSKKNMKIVKRDAVYAGTNNKERTVTNVQTVRVEILREHNSTDNSTALLLEAGNMNNISLLKASLADEDKNKFQNVTLPDKIEQSYESHRTQSLAHNSSGFPLSQVPKQENTPDNANTVQRNKTGTASSGIKPLAPQGPPLTKNTLPSIKSQGASYQISTPEKAAYETEPVYGFPLIIPLKEVPGHHKPLQAKIHQFYKVLCTVINSPDIPKIDIITFIAQRCLLLAYAGLIR